MASYKLRQSGAQIQADLDLLDSNNAFQGQVLTADGQGGAHWADIPTAVDYEYRVVDVLPQSGDQGVIYLVENEQGIYSEYVWKSTQWVKIKEGAVAGLILKGYYSYGVFWKEAAHLNRLPDYLGKIYLDVPNSELYYYNPDISGYEAFVKKATESNPGLVKLYKAMGSNEDGTITQKKITEELNKRAELDTSKLDQECLGLNINI